MQVRQNLSRTSTPLTTRNRVGGAVLAEPVVPSSSDEGESAAGLFLGMIPGSLVAAIAKLAVTYVNEQRSAGISL